MTGVAGPAVTGVARPSMTGAARDGHRCGPPGRRGLAEPLVLMEAPFAPHIADELWSRRGHAASLAYEPFPQFDESLAAEPVVTLSLIHI